MHSHDRTLLASLSFADPDKKDSRHDLGCQYLIHLSKDRKFIENVILKKCTIKSYNYKEKDFVGHDEFDFPRTVSSSVEVVVSKGEGQYKSFIGFIDVLLVYKCTGRVVGKKRTSNRIKDGSEIKFVDEWVDAEPYQTEANFSCSFEIKVGRVPIGDIVRQIKLYMEFSHYNHWFLATMFPLSPDEIEMLRISGIHHLKFGPGFEKWAKERESRSQGESEESISI